MEAEPYCSRHFLGTQANVLRSLPFAPPGNPDHDGTTMRHRLLALADWHEDSQQCRLSIMDLQVEEREAQIQRAMVQELASWQTSGSISSLEVGDMGSGDLVLLAGTSRGNLSHLRLTAPLAPGSDPSEVQLMGEGDIEGTQLLPWQQLHQGSVAALDICAETRQAVTAGDDGALKVVPLEGSAAAQSIMEPRSSASYSAVRWSSPQAFITAGTTGGLECWDRRRAGKPQLRSPLSWGLTGSGALDAAQGISRRINCLAVHPSRPHLCVTGTSSGTLAVWDLRMTSAPAIQSTSRPGSGDVLEVHFEPQDPFAAGAGEPAVLFCTSGGLLGRLSTSAEGKPPSILYEEPNNQICSIDVEAATGRDIMCATDQECLVYLSQH
ncbi:g190 [Coccomyxa viridis]|uniref:G190 protein n=1 Tax=Coccomyxa viridis TaxID=1274662 RepID=A0ABP1FH35_9CHLO